MEMVTSAATRRVWSTPDAVLLFATGLLSEFAHNKAVDWLWVSRSAHKDLLERSLDTAAFLQDVFTCHPSAAMAKVDRINRVHAEAQRVRGEAIPHWAYRDFIYLFIDYGERVHEIVYGRMSEKDRVEHCRSMLELGSAMEIADLPSTYEEYRVQRHKQLLANYSRSALTDRLLKEIGSIVGPWRYQVLLTVQSGLLPEELASFMTRKPNRSVYELLKLYRYLPASKKNNGWLTYLLLPDEVAERVVRRLSIL
ncbi:oxygenase MpaB family protein [Rubrobacter aplysinae]|uniref:oxygenase MpaB family protein n=1 Tax=Rubrobacter aplysinae TaxID=909625 RepID=UPI00064B9BC7|nr:oxygenase MpaB family protein [Rubrobacter aplysinae]